MRSSPDGTAVGLAPARDSRATNPQAARRIAGAGPVCRGVLVQGRGTVQGHCHDLVRGKPRPSGRGGCQWNTTGQCALLVLPLSCTSFIHQFHRPEIIINSWCILSLSASFPAKHRELYRLVQSHFSGNKGSYPPELHSIHRIPVW